MCDCKFCLPSVWHYITDIREPVIRYLAREALCRMSYMLSSIRPSSCTSVRNMAVVTINHQWEITYRCFAVDFFTRSLHTRTAVTCLPLCQLGSLVYCLAMLPFLFFFSTPCLTPGVLRRQPLWCSDLATLPSVGAVP